MAFPEDDYTPYGYLDVPTHTHTLSPRGVLRTDHVGFGWHYPTWPRSYGGAHWTYAVTLRVGLDDAFDLTGFDRVTVPYHSHQLMRFDVARGPARARTDWQLAGEDALRVTIAARDARRVALSLVYDRNLAARAGWGESGLVGREEDSCLILQGFEDGDAFVLWTSVPAADRGLAADRGIAHGWTARAAPGLPAAGFLAVPGEAGQTATIAATLGFDGTAAPRIEAILARGRTAPEALSHLATARKQAGAERRQKRAADSAFWAMAPALGGDWPEHWRRGVVYGLETIRMVVKAPVGIYAHIWDGMQILAPRVVLAEAALDALTLAWADPARAQALMLGTFLDAPAPNIPCTREDGTFNMVAADGTICGTGPAWGFPWLVLDWLWRFHPDRRWLARIYPRLAAYLAWWLDHRRDAEGWLVHACSWEAGQDGSPRFGLQPFGPGSPAWTVRPVDLQAAFAHAAAVMAGFAGTLGRTAEVAQWEALATEFARRTDQLRIGTRYADFDGDRLQPVDGAILCVPLALGVASPAQVTGLAPAIAPFHPDRLDCAPTAWAVLAALLATGQTDAAANAAGALCQRVFRQWDARRLDDNRSLPGIATEFWPVAGKGGCEGYGWGAFVLHFLFHTLIGISPTPDGLTIRPNLPPDLRQPGKIYRLDLTLHGARRWIALAALANGRVRVTVDDDDADMDWGATWAIPDPVDP